MNNELLDNLNRIHTTELGIARIRKNLRLGVPDVVEWCKQRILATYDIYRKGKNWYVHSDNCVITINAHSYTVITAHRKNNLSGR